MHRATKVQLLGLSGLVIALYACSVEAHMDEDDYEALCDISATGLELLFVRAVALSAG